MEEHQYFSPTEWNKTDYIYTFPTGSKIEFFSADQPGKVRGPRRDLLFINEANNISLDVFNQLEVRTRKIVFMDWNPVTEFWFYNELLGKRDDLDFITLTYLDNEALPEEVKKTIEARRENKMWWKVYGEGQLGEPEGKIYTGWQLIDEVPFEARLERYGLDFGYSNDETAIGAVSYYNGGYILDEIAYQKGLSNRQIADILLNVPKVLTIADSSEPKSIEEIASYGVSILPSEKGEGSVSAEIQFVQAQKISVTKRSVNLLKEYRNYMWLTDKNGEVINTPSPIFNHLMDAIRYAIYSLRGSSETLVKRQPVYTYGRHKALLRRLR
jgi:phage terminase large subunit